MADGDFTLAAVGTDGSKPSIKIKLYDIVTSADYLVGGYPITPANVGLTVILGVFVISGGLGYVWDWKPSTGKLLGYEQSDSDNDLKLEEIVDSQAISTPTLRVVIFGLLV